MGKLLRKKGLSIGLVFILIAVLFAGMLMNVSAEENESVTQGMNNSFKESGFVYHLATKEEIEIMKTNNRINQLDNINNTIINGQGTGLNPPTDEEGNELIGSAKIVESEQIVEVQKTNIDLSIEPYFPSVRSQASQGSCSAWAATYYANGYLQAKNNGWTQASIGNNDQLLSPAFTYNKVNRGYDGGSHTWTNANIMQTLGVCTWNQMPFNHHDDLSWGSENAWREAPTYRIKNVYFLYTPFDDTDINAIKYSLTIGLPVVFALNAHSYNNIGIDGVLGSTAMLNEYNHANTIVGFDDSITDAETGEIGAFKVVNSWGSQWGAKWGGYGYYWMTYSAFKASWNVYPVCWFDDYYLANSPNLLSVWELNPQCSRDSQIEVGIGNYGSAEEIKQPFWDAGTHMYPNFMCMDITEFSDNSFFLNIGEGMNSGLISSFKIEYYENYYDSSNPTRISTESPDTPKIIPGYVTVNFNYNIPPNANAGGPYEAVECTNIIFDASGSSDPDGDTLQYRWDFESDSTWDTAKSSLPTATYTWNDDHTGIVTVEVSDGVETDTDTATVTVNNVAPTASIDRVVQPFREFIMPTDELVFTGSFTDPGILDTHTIEWNFDDGTITTDTLTPTHTYAEPGEYTIILTVEDDDGGVDTASVEIIVQIPAEVTEELIEDIEDLDVPEDAEKEIGKAIKDLNKAIAEFNKDNPEKAIGKIEKAVKNLMKAQKKEAETQDVIDDLGDLVKGFAKSALDDAIEYAGEDDPNVGKAQKHYDKALDNLIKGKYDKAIKDFKNSYKEAMKAIE